MIKEEVMLNTQKKIGSKIFLLFMVLVSFVAFTGCGGGTRSKSETKITKSSTGSMRMPQSHYTFPNSNVIPIGTASGKARRSGDNNRFPDIQSANQEAMDQAIASKGGDLLLNATIDGTLTTKTTTYIRGTSFSINIDYDYDAVVQGTVAKMEIGKQILK